MTEIGARPLSQDEVDGLIMGLIGDWPDASELPENPSLTLRRLSPTWDAWCRQAETKEAALKGHEGQARPDEK